MTPTRQIGILGGGPAGLSAALWLKNLGFEPWIAEPQERLGGMQNLNFLANAWVLGQMHVTGPDLVARFVAHMSQVGMRTICGVHPKSIERVSGVFRVAFTRADGSEAHEECVALVIATGTRYRGVEVLHGIPGFADVPQEHIAYGPYAFKNTSICAGRRVLVVGGGDNAFENVRLLLGMAATVHLAMRSPPCAQQVLCDTVVRSDQGCHIHEGVKLSGFSVRGTVIETTLMSAVGETRIEVDRIHVLTGYEPNTAFLQDVFGDISTQFAFCRDRYLIVDSAGRTGSDGIYAAGDVCNPMFPSVVSAVAQGARAAKTIEMDQRTK